MAENSVIVEVKDLTRDFGAFRAVDHISLTICRGEIFGFLGPNGAGKSTTIRMLCGILLPTSGDAQIAGFDLTTQSEEIKKNIGYMSQKFSLYPDLTAAENLEFYAGIYGVPPQERKARIEGTATLTGVSERLGEMTAVLTGGWRQRLALACALVHTPQIIFLDEPTSGVDPISRRQFWRLIQKLAASGVTVFVTTHYLEEAEYCNCLALINNGKIVGMGTPGDLKKEFPYPIVYIETADPLNALDLLGETAGLRDISIWGSGLRLALEDGDKSLQALKAALEQAGIALKKLEPLSPTLEDIFVLKTGEEKREGKFEN